MAKYVYPAVFSPEVDGGYSVTFPDLEEYCTYGDTMHDAIMMAQDALCVAMFVYETNKKEIPQPSLRDEIPLKLNEVVNDVACDTMLFRQRSKSNPVEKTVTIPEWMDEMVSEANIDLSQILQTAIRRELGIR